MLHNSSIVTTSSCCTPGRKYCKEMERCQPVGEECGGLGEWKNFYISYLTYFVECRAGQKYCELTRHCEPTYSSGLQWVEDECSKLLLSYTLYI